MYFADELNLDSRNEVEELREFLKTFRVVFDKPDRTYVVRKEGKIIATGSIEKNILKYFFIDCTYSGQGIIGLIFNQLLEHILEEGYKTYFVFTTPNNKEVFKSLRLSEVGSTSKVILLEGGFYNIDDWINDVKKEIGPKKGKRGAIVANCNPMTLGHKYLVSEALEYVEELLLFVVEEDASVFPFKNRYEIVKEELKDMENVKVLKGGYYIISSGTFPTYFIKKQDDQLDVYTELDATIFAKRVAKGLDINIRFIGTEDKDIVTNTYNRALIKLLGDYDVETKLIPRLKIANKTVSATTIRNLIKEDKYEDAYKYLTKSSKRFLNSPNGEKIIQKIKNENAI